MMRWRLRGSPSDGGPKNMTYGPGNPLYESRRVRQELRKLDRQGRDIAEVQRTQAEQVEEGILEALWFARDRMGR
jgi:hypothetical protein